jgi:hypothetical protein
MATTAPALRPPNYRQGSGWPGASCHTASPENSVRGKRSLASVRSGESICCGAQQKEEERTLLELANAEGRANGWGFMIIDQVPPLLSKYVWDNMGTVVIHRLTNLTIFERVRDAIGSAPSRVTDQAWLEIALNLPEDLCVFRSYLSDVTGGASSVGLMSVSRVKS